MRFLRSPKCSKTIVELMFTTQKANACGLLDFCLVLLYPFWVNLIPKLKIVSLSWNLVLRLIRICITPWWCSFFLFLTGNTFFGGNLIQKIKIVTLSWTLVQRLIRMWIIQCYVVFPVLDRKYPFFGNLFRISEFFVEAVI